MKLRAPLAALCCLLCYMAAPAYAQTAFSGTIQATFWISTATPVPSGDTITCDLNASVFDNGASSATYVEDASVTATVSSATAAYCVVTIPYIWTLVTQSTDVVVINYTINYTPGAGSTNLNARSTQGGASLGSPAVPADGGSISLGPTTVRL